MNIFYKCFSAKNKKSIQFSTRSSMIISPVAGRITEINDPNKDVWCEQYSSGDQKDKNRIPFWNSGFSACPKCCERNMSRFEGKSGVRLNGETYGTEVFRCKTKDCRWYTTFKFDDKDPDHFHSETAGWQRGIIHYPNTFMIMWVDKHKLPAIIKHQIFLQKIHGDKLLHLLRTNQLKETLKTTNKIVKRIEKAVNDKHGAILLP